MMNSLLPILSLSPSLSFICTCLVKEYYKDKGFPPRASSLARVCHVGLQVALENSKAKHKHFFHHRHVCVSVCVFVCFLVALKITS